MRRTPAVWTAVLAAVAAVVVIAPAARALPGDAPIALISPAEGAVVAPSPDGSRFVFACPVYRTADFGDGFALYGARTDYTAALASSPELGSDGRLRQDRWADLAGPQPDNTLPAGQCATTLGDESRAGLAPGTYWWQVARICSGCAGSYETSELRRLIVRADVKATVSAPPRIYATYPAAFAIAAAGAPDGSAVALQRQAGGAWRRVASGTTAGERAELVAALPAGRQRLRVTVTVGSESFSSPAISVRARPDSGPRATSAASDGGWSGTRRAPVSFTVADDGRTLRGFRANVTMTCPAVPAPGSVGGQITTQAGVAAFGRARIAPDGSFFGVTVRGPSSVLVRGRLAGRSLSGGEAQLSVGPCSGRLRFGAARG